MRRILHLGPGAFFRAFNAPYTQDADDDWLITAVSLRSAGLRDMLVAQDYRYHAVAVGPDGMKPQEISVVDRVLVAPENPKAVLDAMADDTVRIVSMTITEKGYCHNPSTGELDLDHPDIVRDLNSLVAPVSAVGFLVKALAMRRETATIPFTVLSCDNLPDNGALTKRVVLKFAQMVDGDLADWITEHVKFPATMVDRITPATTDDDIERLKASTGIHDRACVMHEPFRQWVIEDNFVEGLRPDWDRAGAQFAQDVTAFEAMKLRCLNGTHSALAYLGYLAGYQTISETVSNPVFATFVEDLWTHEIIPTVPQPEGEDLMAYCASLMKRYRNPAIAHRTWQIAMDGSQKLPQRLLGTIADNLAANHAIGGLALVVAAWMRYVGGADESGNPIDVRDPLADVLRAASVEGQAEALLDVRAVFGGELAANPVFREEVIAAYQSLVENGARGSVQDLRS